MALKSHGVLKKFTNAGEANLSNICRGISRLSRWRESTDKFSEFALLFLQTEKPEESKGAVKRSISPSNEEKLKQDQVNTAGVRNCCFSCC